MAKKKKDVEVEIDETELDSDLEGEAGDDTWFQYDAEAFTVLRNEENGRFDLVTIKINSQTNEVALERENTRYDSISRAIMDIQVRMEQELTKRGK